MTDDNINLDDNVVFDDEYYGEKYFADEEGILFTDENNITHKWGYRNKFGEWTGCEPIVKAWNTLFNPVNMLDVGCGRGTFVTYARDIGIEAVGFDFSNWAIDNPYTRCDKNWLSIHNATEPFPYPDKSFDLVTVLDLMEHIYIQDIQKVMDEIVRVSKKYIFMQIATLGDRAHPGYILDKGMHIPANLRGTAVSGHVTILPNKFWIHELSRSGWILRNDLLDQFKQLVPEDVISNWTANLVLIMERE